ncbi:MAG TPA: tetratricopeptide repeat protein [Acidimicrobiales bacterium]|nr:tetratricopeptide repeat protein [Acidimicrobiales bacterium]
MPSERPPLPEGTITYCFTDVVGSTVLWDTEPDAARAAMVRHDAVIEAVVEEHNGMLVRPRGEGDSRFGVFRRATDAAAAALHIQLALGSQEWETSRPIQVRIALHMGEAEVRDGDYYGGAVNRCARLRSLAHPGQILLSAPVAEVVAEHMPDGAELHDLGTHRLKDLSRAEHVRGLTGPGTRSDFPPIVSLDHVPNNLPVQLTPLIGRETEVASITERFGAGHRLVTITGPGGAGKTRLALQVAAEATDKFGNGVFLVALDAVTDPNTVCLSIANTLEAGDAAGSPIDAVVDRLGDDDVLLVLDNFERVLEAAAFVAQILAACPNVCVLATSRERLHLRGEIEWPLASLDLPNSALGDDAVAKAPAVELFVERARAVAPTFELSDSNRDAVVEICRKLDGLPLAIELAAARSKLLAPAELLARLDSDRNLLGGRRPDAPPRHQTMLDTIAWSHEMLSEEERVLFRRFSVFAGGATLDAVEAVCAAEDDVLDVLGSLVDKSLVRRSDEPGAGTSRFAMLRTIRDFAANQLAASGETDTFRNAHAAHYCAGARVTDPGLADEQDNLRATLDWLIASEDATAAHTLAADLEGFWARQGQVTEGREWLRRVLDMRERDDEPARARAVLTAGMLAAHQADLDEAQAHLSVAEQELRRLGGGELARCLMAQGNVSHELGETDAARSTLADALEAARNSGEDRVMARVLYNLGAIELAEGDTELAEQHLAQSLEQSRRLDDAALIGMSLGALGQVRAANDDLEGAQALLEECLALGRTISDVTLVCMALDALGDVARAQGRLPEAEALLIEALTLEEDIGDKLGQIFTLENLAALDIARGRFTEAATMLGAVEALRTAEGLVRYGADRAENDRTVDEVRSALGEDGWSAADREGRTLSGPEVCAYARRSRAITAPYVGTDTVPE